MKPAEQFIRTVERGDAQALRALLSEHGDLRATINDPLFVFDAPALASVAGSDNLELVNVLLEFGADPNAKSRWWAGGFHPLYSARGKVADRLLEAGAIPDACAAAQLDRADLLERMIAENPSCVHERGGDGQTPLHFARSRRVVDMLLAAGADIDARDVDHRSTAAEWMLGGSIDHPSESRIEIARYLVERGATADIFMAAALGLTDRVRALLEQNPSLLDLRAGQGEYGEKPPSSYHIYQWTLHAKTPLETAVTHGHPETLAVMRRFATPAQLLLLACHGGDGDEARRIVSANPGIVGTLSGENRRALTDEAWAANAPAVELLLELGFDPAAPSVSGPTGGTALHCAAWEGSVGCVSALLRYPSGRALINTRETTYGGTPLSWCSHGSRNCGNPTADHASVARLLLEAGADLDPNLEPAEAMRAVLAEWRATR